MTRPVAPRSVFVHRRVSLVLAFGTLALIAGCGDQREPSSSSGGGGDGTLVTLTRTGGYAPIYEKLTIRTDGRATVVDGFPGSRQDTLSFTLSPHELGEVEAAVAAADLEASESVPACADCIEYKVETSRGEVSFADIDSGHAGNPPQIPDEVFALVGDLGTIAALHAGSDPPSAN